jgi:hypothetical protein
MTTIEAQHLMAYEIHGTLLARGYREARLEIAGGGIAEVIAPLPDNAHTGNPQQIRFSSYVADGLFVEQLDGDEWLLVWYLPSALIETNRPIWLQTAKFLDELENEMEKN